MVTKVVIEDHVPIALPLSADAKDDEMMERLPGIIKAPPNPWMPLHSIRKFTPGEKPQAAEPHMKMMMPVMNIFFRPSLSPNDPPKIISEASMSRYALRIQNRSVPDASKDLCKEGNATFKAVPSMNAIAEARIVAVIIHLPAVLLKDTNAIKYNDTVCEPECFIRMMS